MLVGLGPRFLIEALFLIAVAVALGVARLGWLTIVFVMFGAWLLMATIEWLVSHVRAPGARGAIPATGVPEQPAVPAPTVPRATTAPETTAEPAAPIVAEQPPPVPEPAPDPEVTPTPSPPEPAPSPAQEPEAPPLQAPPEPTPQPPRIAAVAIPIAVPVIPAAEPEPGPEPVVSITSRMQGPREWNLWELERLAREVGGSDTARDEERSYLLMYLREFADADGVLPVPFDGIVRESFADVLNVVHT